MLTSILGGLKYLAYVFVPGGVLLYLIDRNWVQICDFVMRIWFLISDFFREEDPGYVLGDYPAPLYGEDTE